MLGISLNSSYTKLVNEYTNKSMSARNLANHTRIAYETDVRQFLHFIMGMSVNKVADTRKSHVTSYLANLDRQKLASNSRRRKFYAVADFYQWLEQMNYIDINPIKDVEPPSKGSKEPRVLATSEYERLLAQIHDVRDRAIVGLVLQTGIRLSEIYQLNIGDVTVPKKDSKEAIGEIRILAKGRKYRAVILNRKACRVLSSWLKARPHVIHDALFTSERKTRLSKRQIQRVCTKYFKEADIHGASIHSLRHTFATRHIFKGTPLVTVQKFLGHKSINTTESYISITKKWEIQYMQQNAL